MRELRSGKPLPAPQTAGPARGVVPTEAGKHTLDTAKAAPEPPLSGITLIKTRNVALCLRRCHRISYLRRASLVDSVYPYQYSRFPAGVRISNDNYLHRFGYFEDTMPFGWPRLSGWCDHWPQPVRDLRRTTECRFRPWLTHLAEYREFDESSAQLLAE